MTRVEAVEIDGADRVEFTLDGEKWLLEGYQRSRPKVRGHQFCSFLFSDKFLNGTINS